MEVVDKFWLARGYKSSAVLMHPFEMQLNAMSWSGTLKEFVDNKQTQDRGDHGALQLYRSADDPATS